MAVKCKKCIHSYYGHIKREGMGGIEKKRR